MENYLRGSSNQCKEVYNERTSEWQVEATDRRQANAHIDSLEPVDNSLSTNTLAKDMDIIASDISEEGNIQEGYEVIESDEISKDSKRKRGESPDNENGSELN